MTKEIHACLGLLLSLSSWWCWRFGTTTRTFCASKLSSRYHSCCKLFGKPVSTLPWWGCINFRHLPPHLWIDGPVMWQTERRRFQNETRYCHFIFDRQPLDSIAIALHMQCRCSFGTTSCKSVACHKSLMAPILEIFVMTRLAKATTIDRISDVSIRDVKTRLALCCDYLRTMKSRYCINKAPCCYSTI